MKIVVLNGSPKGDLSITMQYVKYIQKKFPKHELKIFNISQKIKKIKEDKILFQEIINEIKSSDGILWAFPVYVLLIPSQYKRFIELIFERKKENVFKNIYTAVLTTSIHYFDNTAHNYMNAICDDLGMNYLGSYSADMQDLLEDEKRRNFGNFIENYFEDIESKVPTSKRFKKVFNKKFDYFPSEEKNKIDIGEKKLVVLTDSANNRSNLSKMIEKFNSSFSENIQIINLNDIDIKGGCLGCIHCGYDNICVYQGKDSFAEFYNTKLKNADILVFAGEIKDRYLSSKWKQFFDRAFFNNHVPMLKGKQIGFIISGPLEQIPNLRQILEAYSQLQHLNLVDIITDEYGDSSEIDILLYDLARRLLRSSNKNYTKEQTYLGIGGHKIFRDEIWGRLRFVFQADHKYYKKNGMYDFPQNNYKDRIKNSFLMFLTKFPSFRKEIYTKRMKKEMVKPFIKVLRD